MTEPDARADMRRLEERIAAARKAHEAPARPADEHYSGAQMAWRMVTELVAGLLVGFGIGYGLDVLLGTSPWLMVLFIMLGFAAGVNVMLRTARSAGHTAQDAGTDEGGSHRGD